MDEVFVLQALAFTDHHFRDDIAIMFSAPTRSLNSADALLSGMSDSGNTSVALPLRFAG